jgi:hypothetical protein
VTADTWLVAHSGPPAEVRELVDYARDCAEAEGHSPQLVVVARQPPADLPAQVRYLDQFPVTPWFEQVGRVFTAAGWNSLRQLDRAGSHTGSSPSPDGSTTSSSGPAVGRSLRPASPRRPHHRPHRNRNGTSAARAHPRGAAVSRGTDRPWGRDRPLAVGSWTVHAVRTRPSCRCCVGWESLPTGSPHDSRYAGTAAHRIGGRRLRSRRAM